MAAKTPAARQAKADPRASRPLSELASALTSYGQMESPKAELVACLAAEHPRAFWSLAKKSLFERVPDRGRNHLARACAGKEALIRLAILAGRKAGPLNGPFDSDTPDLLLEQAMALPGKSDAWRSCRLASLVPRLRKCSASHVFDSLASAAIHGRLAACREIARAFPDIRGPEEDAKRLRFGVCGYVGHRFGEREDQAHEIARIEAWAQGRASSELALPKRPRNFAPRELPGNPIFQCAHRWRALLESDPAQAQAWGELGAELIARGAPVEDNEQSFPAALMCDPMRAALRARRPALGSPSFHCFSRSATLMEAFKHCRPESVLDICGYDATGTKTSRSEGFGPIPAEAFALLAGHAWIPAWAGLAGDPFKIPTAAVELAKGGLPTAWREDARGKAFALKSLAKALGRLPKAPRPRAAKP